jgi:hypothetical protein
LFSVFISKGLIFFGHILYHWHTLEKNTYKIKFSKNSGNLFPQYWAIYFSYQIQIEKI